MELLVIFVVISLAIQLGGLVWMFYDMFKK